eukprot:SAG22_NODE_1322_length_4755_cov_49.468428_3_plen_94_part_00
MATNVMTKAGVIGFSAEQSDVKQKKEEQEDYAIMMAERKKSKTLSINKLYIQPFLTWKGEPAAQSPSRLASRLPGRSGQTATNPTEGHPRLYA